jgi:hypothetical protein
MAEKYAKTLRNVFLVFALLGFLTGVLQIILFGYGLSLRTGLSLRLGITPHTFAEGTMILVLISIAFGIIYSSDSRKS